MSIPFHTSNFLHFGRLYILSEDVNARAGNQFEHGGQTRYLQFLDDKLNSAATSQGAKGKDTHIKKNQLIMFDLPNNRTVIGTNFKTPDLTDLKTQFDTFRKTPQPSSASSESAAEDSMAQQFQAYLDTKQASGTKIYTVG